MKKFIIILLILTTNSFATESQERMIKIKEVYATIYRKGNLPISVDDMNKFIEIESIAFF